MKILGLDVGGANLKASDGRGFACSLPFELWRRPKELAAALAELVALAPESEMLAATMTGELADCYRTKREGVAAIVDALSHAAGERRLAIYSIEGRFLSPREAAARPLDVAAANWHALAAFAGRFAQQGTALVVDVGSTTTDIIPVADGRVCARGRTDPDRLAAGELVYTGVARSAVSGIVRELPWRGAMCPVANELFATSRDAYLLLGLAPEDAQCCATADGRPATREAAHARLARCICADAELFDAADARQAAVHIHQQQARLIAAGIQQVVKRLPQRPSVAIISGEGEFLARDALRAADLAHCRVISLSERFGPTVSQVLPAHAVAVLCEEWLGAAQ